MSKAWRDALAVLLRESPIFGALTKDECAALARLARRKRMGAGETLWRWGEPGVGLAVVVDGALAVQRERKDGRIEIFRRFDRGGMVGFSTIAGEVHTADVMTPEGSDLAILPTEPLKALLGRRPAIALAIIAHLGHLIGLLSDELDEKVKLRGSTIEVRICHWLRERGADGDTVAITQAALARQVNATRENVARALARLEDRGVLRRRRGAIEIVALGRCPNR